MIMRRRAPNGQVPVLVPYTRFLLRNMLGRNYGDACTKEARSICNASVVGSIPTVSTVSFMRKTSIEKDIQISEEIMCVVNVPNTESFRSVGKDRVQGRQIKEYDHLYGVFRLQGLPWYEEALFGLEMEATDRFPNEHLILAVPDSAYWLFLDGHPLMAYENRFLPDAESGHYGFEDSDHLKDRLVGSCLESVEVRTHSSRFTLRRNDGERHTLVVPQDKSEIPTKRPLDGMPQQPLSSTSLQEGDSLEDAWILSPTKQIDPDWDAIF